MQVNHKVNGEDMDRVLIKGMLYNEKMCGQPSALI